MATKIPYVIECDLFKEVEIKYAEELLAEYNDFKIYNLAQYRDLFGKTNDHLTATDKEGEPVDPTVSEIAEHNSKVATDHFLKLFGSHDFPESAMVGLKLAWYDLQQILLEEYKTKISSVDSAMNDIAPRLRNVASIMLLAGRIVGALEKMNADKGVISMTKDGFNLLMKRIETEDLKIPEYISVKNQLNKFRKPEQFMDFCEKLFFS